MAQTNPDEVREAAKQTYGDPEDGQHYNDRAKLDFDPADGLYSGTAVEGTSEIAGPHENQDNVGPSAEEAVAQVGEQRVDPVDQASAGAGRDADGRGAGGRGADASDETGGGAQGAMSDGDAGADREPADVAAGREIDFGAARDAHTGDGGDEQAESAEAQSPRPGPRHAAD
jgi:hypothetical protein